MSRVWRRHAPVHVIATRFRAEKASVKVISLADTGDRGKGRQIVQAGTRHSSKFLTNPSHHGDLIVPMDPIHMGDERKRRNPHVENMVHHRRVVGPWS